MKRAPLLNGTADQPLSRNCSPRQDAIDQVARDLTNEVLLCQKCRLGRMRIQAVPAETQPGARILLMGESPGATEDRAGQNFCGLSGRFLDRILEQAGLSRQDVNVSPILHCHPPGNRNPRPDEVRECLPYLYRHLQWMCPEFIVVMGSVAAWCFASEKSITAIAGAWREFEGRPTLFTYHPAAGMRFPAKGQAMALHFQDLAHRARKVLI